MTKESMAEKVRDNLGEIGFIVNYETLEIVYMNKLLKKQLNFQDDDYIGKKCFEIFHNQQSPCQNCYKNELRSHKYIDSTKQHYLINSSIFNEDNTNYMLSIAFNITYEINQINKLKEHVRLDESILKCARTLVYENDFDIAIQKLLEIICSFNEADQTIIFERNYNKNITSVSHIYSKEKFKQQELIEDFKENYVYSLTDQMAKLEKVFHNQPYLFVEPDDLNLENYGYCCDILNIFGNTNLLLVPLKIDRVIVGSVVVVNVNEYSPNFQLLTTVATFISNNLNIKYSRKKLETMVSNLKSKIKLNDLVIESTKTLIDNDDTQINESIEKILKILSDHFKSKAVYVFRFNDNLDKLFTRFEYLKGVESNVTDFIEIPSTGIESLYKSYQKDDILYISSVEDIILTNSNQYNWILEKDVKSFISTQLYQSNKVIGYLWIEDPCCNFDDISVIKTIATLIVSHGLKYDLVKQLEHLSYTDDLTSLYNRNFFMKYIQQINSQPRNNIGVIFADVNGLKSANDKLGHEYGDILIKWSAKFFKKHIHGFIFRIGGDEFIAVLENVDKEYFDTTLNNIEKELLEHSSIHLSIGAIWEENIKDIELLIKKADNNMYENKTKYYEQKRSDNLSEDEELSILKQGILDLNT